MLIKKNCLYVFFAASLICFIKPALAENPASYDEPWKKFNVDVGYYISSSDTTLGLGVRGLGVEVDLEEFFGLDDTTSLFKINAFWRFTNNRRHRLDLKWYSFHRDGNTSLLRDITIEDKDGNEITLPIGTNVFSKLDLDLYKAAYSYSFFQDDRVDLAGSIGCYVMPVDIEVKATGLVSVNESVSFDAPLPTFGVRADFAITPKWFFRTHLEIFYLEYKEFEGSIVEATIALEYLFWKHLGCGLAFDTFNLHIEADGEDYPEIDFKGELDFNITGLLLYMKMAF